MINTKSFVKILNKHTNLITGVPDSLLKNFITVVDKTFKGKHVISTNEG